MPATDSSTPPVAAQAVAALDDCTTGAFERTAAFDAANLSESQSEFCKVMWSLGMREQMYTVKAGNVGVLPYS